MNNLLDNSIETSIVNSTVTADDNLTLLADTDNSIEAFAGVLAAGASVGVGGSVVVNQTSNTTRAFIDDSTVAARGNGGTTNVKKWNLAGTSSTEALRGLAVIATTTETINTVAVTASAGTFGVGLNSIVTTLEDTTEAYITDSTVNSTSQPGQWVVVRAHQSTDVTSSSGGFAGGAAAGFGAASDTTTVNNTVRAFIADTNDSDSDSVTTSVEGLAGVDVLAVNYEEIASVSSAGALSAGYSLAGSVSVVETSSSTHAHISGARVKTNGSLKVRAGSTTDVDMVAGGLSVGLAGGGVGGSVAYVKIANTTKADITDSTTDAQGETLVQAQSTEDVYTVAATFGGGTFAGIAGAVTMTLMVADTRAFIGSSSSTKKSKINQNEDYEDSSQDVTVLASDDATIQDRSGGESEGLVAVGAAVDVASIRNDVSAFIGSHSLVTAGGSLEVQADGNKSITSKVYAASVGGLGIAGSISVLSVGVGIDSEDAGYVTPVLSGSNNSTGTSTNDAVSTSTTQHGTTAFIGSLATVEAGSVTTGSVTVSADDEVTITSTTGSVVAGVLSVGASVASIKQSQLTSAYVDDQASVSATGNILVQATLTQDTLTATALTASAGLAGNSNNQISKIGDGSSQSAYLDAGAKIPQAANVTIKASADRELLANSPGGGFGGISIGVSKADARITGSTQAYVGTDAQIGQTIGLTVGSLTVTASADNDVTAKSLSVNVAAEAAIGVSQGTAKIDDNIQAFIGSGADISVTGSVDVRAVSLADADAQMTAVSVAKVSVGVVTTTATITPNIAAFVNSLATVRSTGTSAGNLSVQAFHNYSTGTTPAALTDHDATARANAPSGGIVSGNGAVPTATSSATVQSYVRSGTTLSSGGEITIASRSYNDAFADADALTVGLLLGVGTSLATATSGAADTTAHFDGTISGASQLSVLTETLHVADADADAAGGGLLAGNGAVATASIPQSTNIRAYLGNNASVTTDSDILIQSKSETDADADVFSKIGGLFAIGAVSADAEVKPNIQTYVGNNASVTSTAGQITIRSLHNYTTGGSIISDRKAKADADAASGGFGALIGTKAAATSNASAKTWAGTGAKLDAGTHVALRTWSNNEAHADADGEANGVVSKGGVTADATANGITRSFLDNVASVNAAVDFAVTAIATNTANADADGSANGFSGDAGAKATATGAPTVEIYVGSSGLISIDDDGYFVAQSRGNVTSHADTASSGLAASGDPHAFANWNPIVTATVGAGTKLQAGDVLNLNALHNFSERSKDPDESRYVKAVADASGRAFDTDLNPEATVNTDVTVLANVGAGAHVTAGTELDVFAGSYNKAEAFADGDSTSVSGLGSVEATANMASDVQAKTDDASTANPTVLAAGTKVSFVSFAFNATAHPVLNSENRLDITADVKATSTMKNVGGSILGQAVVNLTNPVSLARLGNSTQIQALDAEVRVESSNNASLVAKSEVKQTGQVGEVDAKTIVTLSDSRTLAEVGSNADVTARKFTLRAYDDNDGLFTPKVGALDFSGGNFVIAPADIDLPNGVINIPGITVTPSADSTATLDTTTAVKIGSGSFITAREAINIQSGSESNRSRAHAETSGNGNGTLRTDANNYKEVWSSIATETGSRLTSNSVTVNASRPEVVGTTQYEKHSKVASANIKREDKSGTEEFHNYVQLYSNITALGGSEAVLTVDSDGKVTQAQGVSYTVGDSAIVVQDVTPTGVGRIDIQASSGSTYGSSKIFYGTEFGKVTITNNSAKNLFIDKIDNNNNGAPTITEDATSPGWTWTRTYDTTPGADIEIHNKNAGDFDVTLRGVIDNPEGTTTIHNAGGDILQSSGSIIASGGSIIASGGSIMTRRLELTADQRAIGTSAAKIPVLFVAGAAWTFGIEKVSGNLGVALDVRFLTDDVTVPTLKMTDLTSAAGTIEVMVRNTRQLASGLYAAVASTVQLGANVSAAGSLLFDLGTSGQTTLDQTAAFSAGALGVRATGSINLASNLNNVTGSVALSSSGGLPVQFTNSGTIELGSLSVGGTQLSGVSTIGNVTLTSANGAIRDKASDSDTSTDTDIAGNVVTLTAKTGIGDSDSDTLDTAATRLDVSVTGAGSIFLNELDGVTLTDVDTANGAINISAGATIATDVESLADSDANDITLKARTGHLTVGFVTAKSAGDVNLTATAGSILENVNNDSSDVVGDVVTLTAATGVGQFADLVSLDTAATSLDVSVTGSGSIFLNELNGVTLTDVDTFNGTIVISSGAMIATDVRSLTDSDANDVILIARTGKLTVGFVAAGAFGDATLTALTGSILDDGTDSANDSDVDLVGDVVKLTAKTAIGQIDIGTGSLDTTASTLIVSVTGSGHISLSETNNVTLSAVDTANGSIQILSGGAMTATKVRSITDHDANDIFLKTSAGNLTVGSVKVGPAIAVSAKFGDVTLEAETGGIVDDINDTVVDVIGDVVTLKGRFVGDEVGGTIDVTADELVTVTPPAVAALSHDVSPFGGTIVRVNENTTAVTTVPATGLTGTPTFTLSGTDAARFTIDATGALAFLTAPNFEAPTDANSDNYYLVTVTATASSQSVVKQYDVKVRNVNEAPTNLALSSLNFPELQTAVGTLSTTDPDSGNTHSYSLVAGDGATDNGYFAIDGNTLKVVGNLDKTSYSIRVRTQDQGGLAFEKILALTLDDDDTVAPVIVLGGSTGTRNDGQTQAFTWSVTDNVGLGAVGVEVRRNDASGAIVFSSSNARASGSFNFDSFGLGAFFIKVTATDNDADRNNDALTSSATRTVNVTDDDMVAPVITLGGSSGLENDGQTQAFTWNVTDASGLSSVKVVVTKVGEVEPVFTSSTASGSFNFDSQNLGTFQISVTATDNDADWTGDSSTRTATRSVTVTDDDITGPTVSVDGASGAQTDGQTQQFTWNVSDASGLASNLVTVTQGSNTVHITDVASGNFHFDALGLGTFTLTVAATDNDNDRVDDQLPTPAMTRTVSVSDDDVAGPVIDLDGPETTVTDDQLGRVFNWNIADTSGLANLMVVVTRDDVTQVFSSSAAVGSYDFTGDGLGTFKIRVDATDADNDRPNDSQSSSAELLVTVTDDDSAAPVIDLTGSNGSETDGQTQSFDWDVTDISELTTASVTVTKNGATVFSSTNLSDSFHFNALGPGDYQIDVTAADNDADRANDSLTSSATRTVTVTDDDTAAPVISLTGSSGSESDALAQSFTWGVTDNIGLGTVDVTVTKGADVVFTSTSASGTFNFDALGPGEYQITTEADDADNDWTGDTLSTSATRTVTVTDDDSAAPVITLGGSTGAENDGQTQAFTWNITDNVGLGAVSVMVTKDGVTILNSSSTSGSFNFDSQKLGTFLITATATDSDADWTGDALTFTSTRSVTVSDDDIVAPNVVLGGSTGTQTELDTQEFTWNASDSSGLVGVSVTVKKDGVAIFTSNAVSGSFNFDGQGIGFFRITVVADDNDFDWAGDRLRRSVSRSVTVNAGPTPPVITLAGSTSTETDEQGQEFTWDVTGSNGQADVSVRKNGTVIFSSTDVSDSFAFDDQGPGEYLIDVSAEDVSGALVGSATRSVTVTDDDEAAPVITLSGSVGAETDAQTQAFIWDVTDASGLETVSVLVTQNGNNVFDSTDASGSFAFDDLGPGEYVLTVNATDGDDDWAGDSRSATATRTVTVTDDDAIAPVITLGGSTGSQTDGASQQFTWNVTDNVALGDVIVRVSQDSVVVFTSAAASGTFTFNTLGLGLFEITVSATDTDVDRPDDALSSTSTRSVTVTDDDSAGPVISLTGSNGTQNDGQTQQFSWTVTDPSGVVVSVVVTRNGTTLTTFTAAVGFYNFDSQQVGTFEIKVTATDNDNDYTGDKRTTSAVRTVNVIDDDTVGPTIVQTGSVDSENDGQNQFFTWNASDPSGFWIHKVQIWKNPGPNEELLLFTNNTTGSFDFNSNGVGSFLLREEGFDNDNDHTKDRILVVTSRSVLVSDDDTDAPVIALGGSQDIESDGQPQQFTWDVSDASGLTDVGVSITRDGVEILSTTDVSGSFAFDEYGEGDFEMIVHATDTDNDWVGDALSSTASRSVSIHDDDTEAPVVVLGGSTGAETDGQTQAFTWDVSGAAETGVLVLVFKGSEEVARSTAPTDSFNFDHLGPGEFSIVVTATDGDSDRDADALDTTSTRTVVVTDDDVQAPEITLGGSLDSENDSQPQVFTWTATDDIGLAGVTVHVTKDDTTLFSSADASGSFNFDHLGPGEFSIVVTATDGDNDWNGDVPVTSSTRTVVVTDDDIQAPEITLGGSLGSENDGQLQVLTWSVTDNVGLAGVTVRVTKDDSTLFSSADASGSFNFDHFGPGEFSIVVTATDNDSDWDGDALDSTNTRTVVVTDDDLAPEIMLGGSLDSEHDGQPQVLTWSVTDDVGLSGVTVRVTQDDTILFSSADASGSFNFDSLGLGTYVLTVQATDTDSDWIGDTPSTEATRTVVVTDDDETAPTITLGGAVGNELSRFVQPFTWDVTDNVGLASVSVQVTKDGVEIFASTALSGVFNLDTNGPGDYVISVSATDNDADWIGDSLSNSAVRSVTVLNENPILTSFSVPSTLENSTSVLTVTATDADLPTQSISFSIVGGADQSQFNITSGGVLAFQTAPDFETPTDADGDNVYVVDVQADDGNGGTAMQTIQVSVANVPELNRDWELPVSGGPFTLKVTGDGELHLLRGNGTDVFTPVTFADVASIAITGSSRADALTVDASLAGFSGSFSFEGGAKNDKLDASAIDFNVTASGGDDKDTLLGGSGDDELSGDAGDDNLVGGAGNDLLDGAAGKDVLDGGGR